MISIVNNQYASRLERLHVLDAHPSQLDDIFDKACRDLFSSRIADIPLARYCDLPRLWEGGQAETFCRSHGYEIGADAGVPRLLKDWPAYTIMVQAAAAGLLPTADETFEQRLQREAGCFRDAQDLCDRRGALKWFDEQKGYGFVTVENGPDAFLHKNVLRHAGIDEVSEGARFRLHIVSNQGKGRVDDVRLVSAAEEYLDYCEGSRRRALAREYADFKEDQEAAKWERLRREREY